MFKGSGPQLIRYTTGRPVRSRRAPLIGTSTPRRQRQVAQWKRPNNKTDVSPTDAGLFDVSKLLETLPKLPPHQQQVVKSLLSNQGREKVDALLKENYHVITQNSSKPSKISTGGRKDLRNKLLYDAETSLETLQEYFPIVAENPSTFDKLFWKSVFQFYKITRLQGTSNKIDKQQPPPYQFFGEVFEVAKLQKNGRIRYACIKVVGDILYSYNTVRMDPFNEVEYLDSLCYFGNSYRAIQIWKSRREKQDVKGSIYWLEVGILYYLQAKSLVIAERLAEEMNQQFGCIQPSVILGFISAYAPSGQIESVNKWVAHFITSIEFHDFKLTSQIQTSTKDHLIDTERAESIFNALKPPSSDDLERAVSILLKNSMWSQSAQLIECMEKCGMKNSVKQMLQVLDSTTRRLVSDLQKPKSLIPRQNKRLKRSITPENNKQLMVVISKIISVYPEVLEYPKFYESWLRGLTGLELYDNAIMVVEAMVEREIKPTTEHVMSLIRSLLAKNKLEIALDLLKNMEDPPSEFYPSPTQSVYGLFMSYGARRSDHQFVNQMVDRMYSYGLEHSPPTFNTLLYYYYRHKDFNSIFKLLEKVKEIENFELNHINYRTVWRILRDYYYLSSHSNLPTNLNEPGVVPPNLQSLFGEMVQSGNFRLSMNVFEHVIQTMLLAGDYQGASAVLCYMDTVCNIKIPGVLAVSVLQLAAKICQKTTYSFPKPAQNELIVQPGYTSEASVPWEAVATKLCEALSISSHRTIEQARLLIELFQSGTSSVRKID